MAAFSPIFLTLYIYHIPLPLATRIFELFLVEGELALIRISVKMLEYKRDKVLSLRDHELLEYIRRDMILDCVDEMSLDVLLDI